jgi:hypothetical protein
MEHVAEDKDYADASRKRVPQSSMRSKI